jgi:hypothetical protein
MGLAVSSDMPDAGQALDEHDCPQRQRWQATPAVVNTCGDHDAHVREIRDTSH